MDQEKRDDAADSVLYAVHMLVKEFEAWNKQKNREYELEKLKETNNYQRMKYNRPYRRKQQLRAAARHRKRRWNM